MKRYLLDTNALGDLVGRRRGVDVRVRAASRVAVVGTATPAVAEFLYGVEHSTSRDHNMRIAQRALARLVVWPFDLAAAEEYGRLFARLRTAGRMMQQPDVMIAAVARMLTNCTVVSSDSDMHAVPGLSVEDWRS